MIAHDREIGGRAAGRMGFGLQLLAASTKLAIDDVISLIHTALDNGVRFLDTADVYAPSRPWTGQGERLVGEALRRWGGPRDDIIVATKGGHILGGHPLEIFFDASPERLRTACEASLQALGVDVIDLYQLHSVDANVPIERSIEILARLRDEGKIREIGLSNVGRGQIDRARAIAPIASVQNRFSVLSLPSRAVLNWCGAESIAFLPYAPLARDEAGTLGSRLHALERVGGRHGASPQQVALAWLRAQGDHVLPIPGATKAEHIRLNIAAADIALDRLDLEEIERDLPAAAV